MDQEVGRPESSPKKEKPMITHDELTIGPSMFQSKPSSADYVAGFDPDRPIELAGKKIVPYSYTLETEGRLKTIHSPSFTNIDEKLFHGGARPSSHGLLLISPIIHPLNRKSPGGVVPLPNPSISGGDPDLHKAGEWPHLISLGFWFPCTTAINTKLVEHGGSELAKPYTAESMEYFNHSKDSGGDYSIRQGRSLQSTMGCCHVVRQLSSRLPKTPRTSTNGLLADCRYLSPMPFWDSNALLGHRGTESDFFPTINRIATPTGRCLVSFKSN